MVRSKRSKDSSPQPTLTGLAPFGAKLYVSWPVNGKLVAVSPQTTALNILGSVGSYASTTWFISYQYKSPTLVALFIMLEFGMTVPCASGVSFKIGRASCRERGAVWRVG